jgi:hypothetical protein
VLGGEERELVARARQPRALLASASTMLPAATVVSLVSRQAAASNQIVPCTSAPCRRATPVASRSSVTAVPRRSSAAARMLTSPRSRSRDPSRSALDEALEIVELVQIDGLHPIQGQSRSDRRVQLRSEFELAADHYRGPALAFDEEIAEDVQPIGACEV